MTGCPRRQEPPPEEGSSGPVDGRGPGAEPRGGAGQGAGRGASVSLNIIRPAEAEQDFCKKRAGRRN